jgi:Cytochrome c
MRRLALLLAFALPLLAGCSFLPFISSSPPTTGEALAQEIVQDVPWWIRDERLPARAIPGAKLFATAGCTACHTYDGAGDSNLGAPDLTAIGSRRLGIRFEIHHLRCPACVNPGSPMPSFAALGRRRLTEVAIFLEASKGVR